MQKALRKKYDLFLVSCDKHNSTAAGILTDFYTALVQAEMKIESLERLLEEYERMYQKALENLAVKREGL